MAQAQAARGEKDRDELQCLELLPFCPFQKVLPSYWGY